MPSVIARRDTPVARATTETPPYPIAALSAAATSRRIRSSRKADKERNRRPMSSGFTSTSIKHNHSNLFYLFPDRPLVIFRQRGKSSCRKLSRSFLQNYYFPHRRFGSRL